MTVRANLVADGPSDPVELVLAKGEVLCIANPLGEAMYVRTTPEGLSAPCAHIDVRPYRSKEVRATDGPRRVFLPEGLIQRGIRLVPADPAVTGGYGVSVVAAPAR